MHIWAGKLNLMDCKRETWRGTGMMRNMWRATGWNGSTYDISLSTYMWNSRNWRKTLHTYHKSLLLIAFEHQKQTWIDFVHVYFNNRQNRSEVTYQRWKDVEADKTYALFSKNSTPIYEIILFCLTIVTETQSKYWRVHNVYGVISTIQVKVSSFAHPFETTGAHLTSQLQKKAHHWMVILFLSQNIKTNKPFFT